MDETTLIEAQIKEIKLYQTRQRNMSVFFKALFLKLMQLLLCLVIMQYFYVKQGKIQPKEYWDGLCRLVFCLSAHLMMQPDIDSVLERLRFVVLHPQNFRTIMLPLTISFLAVVVNFMIEIVMFLSIIHEVEVINMISNFSGMYIVC